MPHDSETNISRQDSNAVKDIGLIQQKEARRLSYGRIHRATKTTRNGGITHVLLPTNYDAMGIRTLLPQRTHGHQSTMWNMWKSASSNGIEHTLPRHKALPLLTQL